MVLWEGWEGASATKKFGKIKKFHVWKIFLSRANFRIYTCERIQCTPNFFTEDFTHPIRQIRDYIKKKRRKTSKTGSISCLKIIGFELIFMKCQLSKKRAAPFFNFFPFFDCISTKPTFNYTPKNPWKFCMSVAIFKNKLQFKVI